MKITNIASSTVIIETSTKKIICDPWLFDGEYYGSWYHYPKLEIKAESFKDIDYIYISHIHPDHLSKKSLKYFDRNIPVLINSYSTKFLKRNIELLGFNVIELEDNNEFKIAKNESITIFSADNCNPELCYKFFGCGKVENVLGSTQIDSYCLIKDNGLTLLNLNDCPFDLAQNSLKENIINKYKIDFLLVGYAGAGPYPQCFEMDDVQKINSANLKKINFLNQSVKFIDLIRPSFYMPFAGTYILGGKLSSLNKYRGIPELDEAIGFIDNELKHNKVESKGVLLNSYKTFDINNPVLEDFIPVQQVKRDEYLKFISNKMFDYEEQIIPDKKEIIDLLESSYKNFDHKRKNLNVESKTKIAINVFDHFAMFNFKGDPIEYISKNELDKLDNIIIYNLDERLLFNILRGPRFAHWNNAEIGSHINFERRPNNYDRNIYYCMNFFHS